MQAGETSAKPADKKIALELALLIGTTEKLCFNSTNDKYSSGHTAQHLGWDTI